MSSKYFISGVRDLANTALHWQEEAALFEAAKRLLARKRDDAEARCRALESVVKELAYDLSLVAPDDGYKALKSWNAAVALLAATPPIEIIDAIDSSDVVLRFWLNGNVVSIGLTDDQLMLLANIANAAMRERSDDGAG